MIYKSKLGRAFLKVRYFIIKLLVGKMRIVANISMEKEDFIFNFKDKSKPYMFFNNNIYRHTHDEIKVYNGAKDVETVRCGNVFTLKF